MPGDHRRRHSLAARYSRLVTRFRWVVVVAWVAAAAGTTIYLPSLHTGSADFGSLIPDNSQAVKAQQRLLADFGVPLRSDTVVVVRNPRGLDPLTQLDVVLRAATFDQRLSGLPRPLPDDTVLGALPILNTAGLFPSSKESGTTAVTYLFFSSGTSLAERNRLAHTYAAHFHGLDGVQVAVTGTVPSRVEQSDLLTSHLTLVELCTLALVTLVVAVTFRSLIAPLVTLAAALLSYLVGIRVLGYVGETTHLSIPAALEPLVVALVLGVLTDYSVFFLTETRDRLLAGEDTRTSVRASLRDNIPIITVAGITVAAGTISLYAATLHLFRSFGPGLAISVTIGALAAITFVPAAMAILGRHVYWPSRPLQAGRANPRDVRRHPSWLVRAISTKAGAAVASVVCVGGLLAAAYPLLGLQLDLSFTRSLPADAQARRGADLVAQGFARGVLAPTTVLVSGPGAKGNDAAERLQDLIGRQPGVAGVLGPATLPVPVPQVRGLFESQSQPEVRYLLFFDKDPLAGKAIDDLRALRDDMPALLRQAGLPRARADFAGDTAIASDAASVTVRNLEIVFGVAFGAEFLILALFLRSLVAPLLLLGASALVVASALGLTALVFQDTIGTQGLTFYVPFATSVLLIALGSDYNVFGAGRIWEAAADSRLKRAIRRALPESSKAITTAGLTLAGSFALVALVPLLPFHEMAFTMFVGLIIDTFVVRSVLTPALLTIVGPRAGGPGRRLLPPAPQVVR